MQLRINKRFSHMYCQIKESKIVGLRDTTSLEIYLLTYTKCPLHLSNTPIPDTQTSFYVSLYTTIM